MTLPDYYSPEHLGMIVPKTKDGRVVFMLPWLDATIAGTTGLLCLQTLLVQLGPATSLSLLHFTVQSLFASIPHQHMSNLLHIATLLLIAWSWLMKLLFISC